MYLDGHSHLDDINRYTGWSTELTIVKMDESGISQAVISSVRGIYANSPQELETANADVLRAVEKYPERLLGSVCVNPFFPDESLREIEKYVAAGPFVMVGEMCQFLQGWDTSAPGLQPIIEAAQELRVPLNMHSSTKEHCDEILEISAAFPDADFIMAHMGGMNRLHENIPRLVSNPRDNLWIDISGACAFFAGYLESLIENLGPERIVFGVDMPLIEPAPLVKRIEDLKLSTADTKKIAHGNLDALLQRKISG